MSKISSYYHLNKKYNLNFTDNNFNFTWEILKEMVTDVWAPFLTTSAFYRLEPTARNLFKTTVHIILAIFLAVNFTDASSKMLRRYEKTHILTTYGKMIEVTQKIFEDYGIDFTENNQNGIKWKIKSDGGGYIKFPGGSVISFGAYTIGNQIMGATVQGSPVLMTWTDEFIDPNEAEPLEPDTLLERYDRLEISILKNQTQKRSYKKIKEWSWTFLDKNRFSKTYGQKITRYFVKMPFVSFSFNNYDDEHPIYEKFVTPFLPLAKCEKQLDETGLVIYENMKNFGGLGIFIMRANMTLTFDLLEPLMKKKILQVKENNPDEFRTIFYGKDFDSSNMKKFVFRRQMKFPFPYDIKKFFIIALNMYKFDFYSIGVDWATGGKDNTVFKVWGFSKGNGRMYINWDDVPWSRKCYKSLQFDKNNTNMPDKHQLLDMYDADFYALYPYRFKTLKMDSYCIAEIVVSPDMNMSETDKTKYFVEAILGLRDWFVGIDRVKFHYDDKAESSIQWIKQDLELEHGVVIKVVKSIKHNSQLNNEAGLIERVNWMRRRLENRPYNVPIKKDRISYEKIKHR